MMKRILIKENEEVFRDVTGKALHIGDVVDIDGKIYQAIFDGAKVAFWPFDDSKNSLVDTKSKNLISVEDAAGKVKFVRSWDTTKGGVLNKTEDKIQMETKFRKYIRNQIRSILKEDKEMHGDRVIKVKGTDGKDIEIRHLEGPDIIYVYHDGKKSNWTAVKKFVPKDKKSELEKIIKGK